MGRTATRPFVVCAAIASLAGLFLTTVAAEAAVRLPKPHPTRAAPPTPAAADAESAIRRMMNVPAAERQTATAYAPSGAATLRPDAAPAEFGKAALYLVAKLSEGGEPVTNGVVWRVYRDGPALGGEMKMAAQAKNGDLDVRLDPGRYVVHASYGRAAITKSFDLSTPTTSDTVVLDAGGLQLDAVLDDTNQPVSSETEFQLYLVENGERVLIGDIRSGSIARLPAGLYHVVSRYGGLNAVRSADVSVEAGKLTRVALRHSAGNVHLKLVRHAGGEALANTAWTILAEDDTPIFERVGAHATLTLAAGRYQVVAAHSQSEFRRSFEVRSGDDKRVVVLAHRF